MRSSDHTHTKELTQTTFNFRAESHYSSSQATEIRIYLYFKVWKVERRPEQRAEVGYGGDFPPRLDFFHRNCTSLGHFRTGEIVQRVFLTLESSFFSGLECLRDITNTTKVAAAVLFGRLPLRPAERYNLL